MPKNTPRNTHRTRKPFFPKLKKQNPFWKINLSSIFFGKISYCWKRFQIAKLLFSSRNQLWKRGGILWPNERKDAQSREKAEKRYFPQSLRKLISSTESKSNTRSPSRLGKHVSFTENLKKIIQKIYSCKSHAEKTKTGHRSSQNVVVAAMNRGRGFRFWKILKKSCIVKKL